MDKMILIHWKIQIKCHENWEKDDLGEVLMEKVAFEPNFKGFVGSAHEEINGKELSRGLE